MIHEPPDRDPALADALTDLPGVAIDVGTDWTRLRGAINDGAASALARRRQQRRRTRFVIPASLAAGIVLFVLVAHEPDRTTVSPSRQSAFSDQAPIDDLLDANLSEGQFRALLAGAGDANDLLAIAAEESRP